MMKLIHLKKIGFLWLLLTSAALLLFLSTPSEAENAFLWGYSKSRLLVSGIVLLFIALQAGLLILIQKKPIISQQSVNHFTEWLNQRDHLYSTIYTLGFMFVFSLGALLFTWLLFPPVLRPIFVLFSALLASLGLLLRIVFKTTFQTKSPPGYIYFLPKLAQLAPHQQQTFFMLMGLGLIYFLLFVPANLLNTETAHVFRYNSGDEGVIYPVLMEMFVPEVDFSSQLYRIFIYEDYHYGYPFYFLSALLLLPLRLLFGAAFPQQIQLNMLLLRQFISVLPIILTAGILVYLVTRFKHRGYAIGLFLFLLLVPAVIKYNTLFWHPDSLGILFIVLTLYFLQRDQYQFGPNWVAAAITCGLASATRLLGFFCVLAVAYILLSALFAKKMNLKKLILAGLVFILVMAAVIVISSPYLLHPAARERFIQILSEKQSDMRSGYNHPDPENIYRTGWAVWLPFIEQDYGQRYFLLYTAIALLITSLAGSHRHIQRLIALWVLPSLGYLIYFVAVKSYQYLMPPLLPFLSAAFSLPYWLHQRRKDHPRLYVGLEVLLVLIILMQTIAWLKADWMLYVSEF